MPFGIVVIMVRLRREYDLFRPSIAFAKNSDSGFFSNFPKGNFGAFISQVARRNDTIDRAQSVRFIPNRY